ncbi:MAG: hypothetical protein ACW967_08385 [Candidatus Hodarchaeales archaeon]
MIEYAYQFWISGELEKADVVLDKEKSYFDIIKDLETKATYYNLKGIISSEKGELEHSIEYLERCLELRKQLNNPLLTAQILNTLH